MDEEQSEQARAAIMEAVETQLADGDPPEAAETLERLLAEGYSRDDAVRLIGCALADEMFQIMKHEREYDGIRYVGLLRKLPDMPWE